MRGFFVSSNCRSLNNSLRLAKYHLNNLIDEKTEVIKSKMRDLIHGIKPIMALLLVLAMVLPVGITLSPATRVIASVDLVTVTSPTAGTPAKSHVGGTVPITFALTVSGPTDSVDVSLFLIKSGIVQGTPTNYTIVASDNSSPHSYTYNLTIPAGTVDGTYDVRVDARHPSGSGSYTSSAVITGCILILSTAISVPTSPLPVTGTCTVSTTPTFSWTPPAGTGLTYNFQSALDSAFTSSVNNQTGLATAAYTSVALTHALYYWHVQAQDAYGNQSVWTATQTICIDPDTPSVPSITSPADGYVSPGKYNPQFVWAASTDASSCANVQYVIQTASDTAFTNILDTATVSGTTYTIGAQLQANSTTGPSTYYWRIKSIDCSSNSSAWQTYRSFQLPLSVTTFNIPLSAGWNLISLPLVPTDNTSGLVSYTLTRVAASILPYVVAIDYYAYSPNCAIPSWKVYYPIGQTFTLTTMEDGKAYWIYVNQACNLTGTGIPTSPPPSAPPQYTLCYYAGDVINAAQGWNMLGFKSNQTGTSLQTYVGGSTNAAKITQSYKYAGGWVPVSVSDNLVPGVGYFINVNTSFSFPAPTN